MPTLQQRMVDSTDAGVRKAAMRSLTDFLRDDLEDLAMRKLWRCIFFAMWLADMAPVQEELARRAGATVRAFGADAAAARWVAAFCDTVRREWGRLDKYRVDKYYGLIRHALREALGRCAARDWGSDGVAAVARAFGEGFLADAPDYPAGVKLHYADVVVDELARAAAPPAAAAAFLAPALALLGAADSAVVACVLDRVVAPLGDAAAAAREKESDGGAAVAVAGAALDAVYAAAADDATPQRHRERLYAAAKTLAAACGRRPAAAAAARKRKPDDDDAAAAPAAAKPATSLRQLKKQRRRAEKKKGAYYRRFKENK